MKLRCSASLVIVLALLVSIVGMSARPQSAQAEIERLTNTVPIQINGTTTSAYPSTIVAPAMPGVLVDVDVYLTGLNYASVGDLQVMLVSPAGTAVMLMTRAGGVGRNVTGASLRFNQSAPGYIQPDNFSSGQFRPSVYSDIPMPAPAPRLPDANNLGEFRDETTAGSWRLYVRSLSNSVGRIDAWRLDLVTDTTVQTDDITVGSSTAPSPVALYPSTLTVAGVPTTGPKAISVGISGLTHDNPGDLDIMLQGPNGQKIVLMSDAGGPFRVSGADLTFSDASQVGLPLDARIASGAFRPTNHFSGDTFPAPAPVGPYSTTLNALGSTNPNGDWKLYIVDDAAGGEGSIAGGWTLHVDAVRTSLKVFDFFNPLTFGGSTAPSAATIYPVSFPIVDAVGPISRVMVTLGNVSHFVPDDIDIRLTSPAGARAQILSDAGGSGVLSSDTLFIDSAATVRAPDNGPLVDASRYGPTNYNARGDIDLFPAPIPSGSYPSSMSSVLGADANGTWRLWIVDDRVGETGRIGSLSVQVETRLASVTNAGAITILNSVPANPYPSNIVVTGAAGAVEAVEVTLDNLDHSFPDDLDIVLAGPEGQSVVLMSDAGGGTDLNHVDLTFLDAAAGNLSDSGQLTSGTYRPTNFQGSTTDLFHTPAQPSPTGNDLAVFNGTNANGTWRLYIVDDRASVDTGDLAGWSLRIVTNEPVTLTDVPDTAVAAGAVVRVSTLVNDPENSSVSFSLFQAPAFTTLEITKGLHTWRFHPELADIGTYPVSVTVSDGHFTDQVSFDVTVFEDATPPTLTVTQSPPPNAHGWNRTDVTVDAVGFDPAPSSGLGFSSASSGDLIFDNVRISPSTQRFFFLGEGARSLRVRAIDFAGNSSNDDDRIVRIDRTAPVSRIPRGRLTQDTQASQTEVPVQIQLQATDALAGVDTYQLRQRVDGGAFNIVSVADATQARVNRDLEPGENYGFRSRATDLAGNSGSQSAIYDIGLRRFNDTDGIMNFDFSAGWSVSSLTNAVGGDAHVASAAGERMSFAWFGTSIAWLATEGPNRGIADVYLDDVLIQTIDLYRPTARFRVLAFTFNGDPSTNAEHILEIRVTGTKNPASSGTRVDVDAFVVIERQ